MRLDMREFRSIVMTVSTHVRVAVLCGIVLMLVGGRAASQQLESGQVSGAASIPGKGMLAGVTAQLRDLSTKLLIGTVKTNASGQFVFIVDHPGTFIVEILDENGAVVGTTSPIVLSSGAMNIAGVTVSPTVDGAAAAATGAGSAEGAQAPGQGEGTGRGRSIAVGAMAGGGVSNFFMPSLPSVSSAVTGAGIAAGTVPSRGAASPSR
jgi:hypothetical protein